MKNELTPQQMGKQICQLRKKKGWSQEELAAKIGVSRPSLAQLELGNRGLYLSELQQLSMVLNFSLDDFVSSRIQEREVSYGLESKSKKKGSERIPTPTFKASKLRNILLYLLEHCAGKPNVNEVVLERIIYFADFNHYEIYEEHLTGLKYRKLASGPFANRLDGLLSGMNDDGLLQKVKAPAHSSASIPKGTIRLLPLRKANLSEMKASEKETLDQALLQMSDWSEEAIVEYTLRDMPVYTTQVGKEINFELVFYREAPYSVRRYA